MYEYKQVMNTLKQGRRADTLKKKKKKKKQKTGKSLKYYLWERERNRSSCVPKQKNREVRE